MRVIWGHFWLELTHLWFQEVHSKSKYWTGFSFLAYFEFLWVSFGASFGSCRFWASFGRFWRVIFLYLYWRLLFVFVFLNKSKSLWLKTCQNLCWGNANKSKKTSKNPLNDKSSGIHISVQFSHDSEYFILSTHLDMKFLKFKINLWDFNQVKARTVILCDSSKYSHCMTMLDTVIQLKDLSGLW